MRERKGRCIIEFISIGNNTKVTACDPETGLEVCIIGPTTATKRELTAAAMAKLKYVMEKGE